MYFFFFLNYKNVSCILERERNFCSGSDSKNENFEELKFEEERIRKRVAISKYNTNEWVSSTGL